MGARARAVPSATPGGSGAARAVGGLRAAPRRPTRSPGGSKREERAPFAGESSDPQRLDLFELDLVADARSGIVLHSSREILAESRPELLPFTVEDCDGLGDVRDVVPGQALQLIGS